MKKIMAIILCMLVMAFTLAGCGELNLEELLQTEDLKDNYIKDIEAMSTISKCLQSGNGDLDGMLKEIKGITVYTLEGIVLKNTYIKMLKLCQEGAEVSKQMTASNYEESLERIVELQMKIDEITNQKMEKQIDALLEAAKRAGVEGEDLQAAGIEF